MAYTKTTWVNEGPPAIDADNLNNIENGIYNHDITIADILAQLSADTQTLTRATGWDSGSVFYAEIGNMCLASVFNLRRSSATSGYIDAAALPAGVTIKSTIANVAFYETGSAARQLAMRVSDGKLQVNTSNGVPTYGCYGLFIFEKN